MFIYLPIKHGDFPVPYVKLRVAKVILEPVGKSYGVTSNWVFKTVTTTYASQECKWLMIYIYTMWAPPVISWFLSPSNYSYKYHKP